MVITFLKVRPLHELLYVHVQGISTQEALLGRADALKVFLIDSKLLPKLPRSFSRSVSLSIFNCWQVVGN